MVLADIHEPSIYYKEASVNKKSARFCLKQLSIGEETKKKERKSTDSVNIQVVKGKTTTFIHLEEDEAKKVQNHGDLVLKKLQRIHKSVIWNLLIGRSFVDKIQKGKEKNEEINLNHDENLEFDPVNPRTWSDESLDFITSVLKASEFSYDGFIVLFCVPNNERDSNEVDYDEMAWELEKCLTYHFIANRSQIIMNEEATMSRKGLGPVSRKTKTPGGKKKSGFCVYLAYQLLDSVTIDQMVGESVNKHVDLGYKKKQLLGALTGTKLMPQVDERIRKQIKEIREFMNKDQLSMLLRLKEIKDPASMEMLGQFLTLLQSGSKEAGGSGLMGLPQFLTFLNKSQEDKTISRPNTAPVNKTSTIPRPSATTGSIRSRKASITSVNSQTISLVSSRCTTPDGPARRMSNRDHEFYRQSGPPSRTGTSSLASIPSSGSLSSNPETLKPPSKRVNGRSSGLPTRTGSLQSKTRPTSSKPTSLNRNGRIGSTTSASNSPRRSGGGSSTHSPVPPEGRITRDDLRRMNKSYPSNPTSHSTNNKPEATKKPPFGGPASRRPTPKNTSFSRASIPMS